MSRHHELVLKESIADLESELAEARELLERTLLGGLGSSRLRDSIRAYLNKQESKNDS